MNAYNPTKLKITNSNPVTLYLQCTAYQPVGLNGPITMQSQLSPNSSLNYVWRAYDNDGLGLNFAQWVCATSTRSNPMTNSSNEITTFKTDWGQDINIALHRHGEKYKAHRE